MPLLAGKNVYSRYHTYHTGNMEEILNMHFFGVSVRWLIVFAIKGVIIYLFIRLLTGVTKYLFRRSMRKQGKITLDETKVSFIRRIIVTAIYIIGIAAFLSLIPMLPSSAEKTAFTFSSPSPSSWVISSSLTAV